MMRNRIDRAVTETAERAFQNRLRLRGLTEGWVLFDESATWVDPERRFGDLARFRRQLAL